MEEDLKRQKLKDGYGPVHHRVYSITIPARYEQVRNVMRALQADPNAFSPQLLAKFEKTKGAPGFLKTDDEFMIYITGPWNGPVRVAEVNEDRFRLVTLEGHLEAGEIRFEIKRENEDRTCFLIESLARSKDGVVDFVYDKVPVAKIAQTEMWACFCKNFAEKAVESKDQVGEVELLIERKDEETGRWEKI
jgi:hypothetical protein